jgi:HK97 family phage major capsid protein
MEALIRQKREKAAAAVKTARELGLQITAKKEKGEACAEVEEQFTKAHKEATDLMKEVQTLEGQHESQKQIEQWHRTMNEPDPDRHVNHRGGDEPSGERGERFDRRPQDRPSERALFQGNDPGITLLRAKPKVREIHMVAFEQYLRFGLQAAVGVYQKHTSDVTPQEMHLLVGTQGDLGGFLVPEDRRAVVLKDMPGVAVIRRVSRVEGTARDTLVFPAIQSHPSNPKMYSSGFTGAWKQQGYVSGGTAPPQQNQPKFEQLRIPVWSWQPDAVEMSQELIEDSGANVVGIAEQAIAETFGLDEDFEYINGNGVGRPEGVLGHSTIGTVNSGAASALTYGGLVDLWANLAGQYRQNARWLMSSLTFGAILKLQDTQQRPLFIVNELPGNLWTRPIIFSEFMPEIAASATPIVFGDWSHYIIADRQGVRVQRLTERFAPNVGLLPMARVGARVSRPNAFKKQVIST